MRDAHVHFFSHRFFSALGANATQLGWEHPDENPVELGRRWVAEFDKHGVESACIIASVPGDEDSVAAAVKAFPDRLHGYFMVDPTADGAPQRAAAALEKGLRGLCFFPAMHRYCIHDPRALELLRVAAKAPGTVAFVHCGVLTVGVRKKLGLKSRFDLRYSNPVDLHAVAMEFEDLPFVIPHFGAGYFREALLVAALCPNVYLDTSSSNSWMRYQCPPVTLRQVFERALDVVGPGRLLFGSDSSFFPRGWVRGVYEEQRQVLGEIGVSETEMAGIFGLNLERLLR